MNKLNKGLKRYSWIIMVLFLTIFMVFVKLPEQRAMISGWFYEVFVQPVVGLSKTVADGVVDGWHRYVALIQTQEENEELKLALRKTEGMRVELMDLRDEVKRLRGIIGLAPKLPFRLKISEVVALSYSLERHGFWINAGQRDNVVPGLPVIGHEGVIGQVFQSSRGRSLVLTLRDPLFRLPVVNRRTKERGILSGEQDASLLLLRYIHRDSLVEVGDVFVTSGLGGVFPHGIGAGRVKRVERPKTGLESKVWLTPLVDVEKVQDVFVILPNERRRTL